MAGGKRFSAHVKRKTSSLHPDRGGRVKRRPLGEAKTAGGGTWHTRKVSPGKGRMAAEKGEHLKKPTAKRKIPGFEEGAIPLRAKEGKNLSSFGRGKKKKPFFLKDS